MERNLRILYNEKTLKPFPAGGFRAFSLRKHLHVMCNLLLNIYFVIGCNTLIYKFV